MPANAARLQQPAPPTRRRIATLLALLAGLICLAGGVSALPLDNPEYRGQRADFLAAERALAAGRNEEFRRLLERLREYPLLVYLKTAELEGRLARVARSEVEARLDEFDGTPSAAALRSRWLLNVGKNGDWKALLSAWRSQRSTELRCYHARALFEAGRNPEAMAATRELWLAGRSQPDACDIAFRRWRNAGGLNRELVWRRVALAVGGGERRLVGYLQQLLPAAERALAELWLEVRSAPSLVARAQRFLPDGVNVREVRLDGLKRLAQRSPQQAADAWQRMRDEHAWSDAERAEALRAVGLGFAQEQLASGGDWLDRIDDRHADERVWEWRAIARLREHDWARLAAVIERMPADMRGDEVWRYWRARAAEKLGDAAHAQAGFELLASERSFHGFLAADRLARAYDFTGRLLRFDDDELRATAAIPGIARARELLALEREFDARREWYAALDGLNKDTLQRAARLAQLWGWHTQAIFTVARASHFDDIELRFPLVYTAEFSDYAAAQHMEPAWVLAVARQESAFMADARSPAGALGLMQIMPATGRGIARELKEAFGGLQILLDPSTSIRFATHYLRTLLDRFDGNPVLAIAAYNAGAHRAERWRPSGADMEADVWIDTVPYSETRRYLRRVFYYTAIYEHRLGLQPTRLSTRLGLVPGRADTTSASGPVSKP